MNVCHQGSSSPLSLPWCQLSGLVILCHIAWYNKHAQSSQPGETGLLPHTHLVLMLQSITAHVTFISSVVVVATKIAALALVQGLDAKQEYRDCVSFRVPAALQHPQQHPGRHSLFCHSGVCHWLSCWAPSLNTCAPHGPGP